MPKISILTSSNKFSLEITKKEMIKIKSTLGAFVRKNEFMMGYFLAVGNF